MSFLRNSLLRFWLFMDKGGVHIIMYVVDLFPHLALCAAAIDCHLLLY